MAIAQVGAGPAYEVGVTDLGGAVRSFCLEQTGSAPQRPHMIQFNTAHTHATIAFVATGHVLFWRRRRARRTISSVRMLPLRR